MRRLVLAALAAATSSLCGLSPAFAEPRAYDPTTKIRITCPATGVSAATTAPQGEGRMTFFSSGEYTCLCVGRATCDSSAASGGICLQQGQAIDLRISRGVPLSCWSHAGLGVAELLSW